MPAGAVAAALSRLCSAAEITLELERSKRPALDAVVLVKSLLQLLRHFLEKYDLLLQEVLHLGLEVAHTDLVEVVDLSQRGEGDGVAAGLDALGLLRLHLPLLHVPPALLHLGQSTCGEKVR